MNEKMKGIEIISVYDEKKQISEYNDGVSETITTGYIPLNEQVAMIIKGEITVGNLDDGFYDDDDDLEKIPEEVFEDATDYMTESELREVVDGTVPKDTGNTSTSHNSSSEPEKASEEEERAKQSDDDKQAS